MALSPFLEVVVSSVLAVHSNDRYTLPSIPKWLINVCTCADFTVLYCRPDLDNSTDMARSLIFVSLVFERIQIVSAFKPFICFLLGGGRCNAQFDVGETIQARSLLSETQCRSDTYFIISSYALQRTLHPKPAQSTRAQLYKISRFIATLTSIGSTLASYHGCFRHN